MCKPEEKQFKLNYFFFFKVHLFFQKYSKIKNNISI